MAENNIFLGKIADDMMRFVDVTHPAMDGVVADEYIHVLKALDFLVKSEYTFDTSNFDHPYYLVCVRKDEPEPDFEGPRLFEEGEDIYLALINPNKPQNPLYSDKKSSQAALFSIHNFGEELMQFSSDIMDYERIGEFFNMDADYIEISVIDWRLITTMIARYAAAKGYSVDLFGIEGPKGPLPFSLLDSFDYFNHLAEQIGEEPLAIPSPYIEEIHPASGFDLTKN